MSETKITCDAISLSDNSTVDNRAQTYKRHGMYRLKEVYKRTGVVKSSFVVKTVVHRDTSYTNQAYAYSKVVTPLGDTTYVNLLGHDVQPYETWEVDNLLLSQTADALFGSHAWLDEREIEGALTEAGFLV